MLKEKKRSNLVVFKHKQTIILLVFIFLVSTFTMPVRAFANPYSGGDGNCTYTAWRLAYENTGIQLPAWGNAYTWYNSARNAGYTVSTVPREKSIAVWSGGPNGLGHVAYVSQVNGDQIYIHEGGYDGGYHEGWENAYGQTKYYNINLLTMTGYIYLGNLGNNPIGSVDVCESNEIGQLRVGGWTYDADSPSTQNEVHVYIGSDDNEGHNLGAANIYRQDVDDHHHCGAYHGFDQTISTNRTGNQRVRVFAINVGAGDNTLLYDNTVYIKPDTEAPELEGYNVASLNENGYTITCTWTDNIGVTDVKFPTWDASGGSDGCTWYQGTSTEVGQKRSTWTFTFSEASANKEYITHIYAYDAAGNYKCFPLPDVIETKNDTTAPVIGDVYQDGKIDGKDVSLILQYRLKKRELTEEQIAAGDVYADGKIDGKDVSKLLQYRLGKIESLE